MKTNEEIYNRIKSTGKYSVERCEYPSYADREALKHEAWVMFARAETPFGKCSAILLVVEMHYWRAREGLERSTKAIQRKIHGKRYYPGCELCLDVYTRHWLAANGDRLCGPALLVEIEDSFGYTKERSKYLPDGMSCYVVAV